MFSLVTVMIQCNFSELESYLVDHDISLSWVVIQIIISNMLTWQGHPRLMVVLSRADAVCISNCAVGNKLSHCEGTNSPVQLPCSKYHESHSSQRKPSFSGPITNWDVPGEVVNLIMTQVSSRETLFTNDNQTTD